MPKFDFLAEYALELLKQNNLDLSGEQKNIYLPQILGQVEERLGLELLPKLNEAQMNEMARLVNDAQAGAEEWKKFWYSAIPTFEQDVKNVLISFAEEVKQLLAK